MVYVTKGSTEISLQYLLDWKMSCLQILVCLFSIYHFISKKLPGYIGRRSSKDALAARSLALGYAGNNFLLGVFQIMICAP